MTGESKENAGEQKYYNAHGWKNSPRRKWGLRPDLLNRNALAAKFAGTSVFVVDGVQFG